MIPASYSFSWALRVVNELKGKYPRATETAKRFLSIDDRNLATYLAKGDPLWPKLRDFIRTIDSWERKGLGDGWNYSNVKYLRDQFNRKGGERIAERLDKLLNSGTLKEQESRERGEGGEADRPPQPFLSSELEALWKSLKTTSEPWLTSERPRGATKELQTASRG